MTDADVLKPVNASLLPETLCTLGRDWPHTIHVESHVQFGFYPRKGCHILADSFQPSSGLFLQSCELYYFILNFMEWAPHIKRVEFKYYAPRGDPIDGAYLAIARFKFSVTYVMVHIDETSKSNLELILRNTKLIEWSQPLIFEAVHDRVLPTLKKILHEKNVKIISKDKVLQLWLPPRLVRNVTRDLQGPDYCVRRLDERYVKLINEHWEHKFPGSHLLIQDCILKNQGLGMFVNETHKPVSWAVEQHYGGIGMLYTMREYRGRGYATAVVKTMIKTLDDKHVDPFVCIEHSNAESLRLFRKLKFLDICNVTWIVTDGIH